MAKHKEKNWSEAELIDTFGLTRLSGNQAFPLLTDWLNATTILTLGEQERFDKMLKKVGSKIIGWQEEDLKMKFIALVLELSNLEDDDRYNTYFERTIEATVDGHYLKTKTDFMVAKGILDMPKVPYFHFQEWKKLRDPSGDPVAQLVEAFLIAHEKNKNQHPIYGATVSGKFWDFFVFHNKTYCVSQSYDCTKGDELLLIIAILRKFRVILETTLLD